MAKTKIVSSSATQMETLPSLIIFEEGTYYPVYANIYKFPNGNLTSAMLLTNGRFVSVGGVVLARHEEEPLTTRTMRQINPQPEDAQGGSMAPITPCLDDSAPQDSEIQPPLKDPLCLSSTLELVNATRIAVASEDGAFLSPSDEDKRAI